MIFRASTIFKENILKKWTNVFTGHWWGGGGGRLGAGHKVMWLNLKPVVF